MLQALAGVLRAAAGVDVDNRLPDRDRGVAAVADREVAGLEAPAVGGDLEVEQRLPRGEHASSAADGVRVAARAGRERGGGHAVHLRQRLVDAQEAQLEIEEGEAERRLGEDGVELGQVALADPPQLGLGRREC